MLKNECKEINEVSLTQDFLAYPAVYSIWVKKDVSFESTGHMNT